jgi:hypothetical protein
MLLEHGMVSAGAVTLRETALGLQAPSSRNSGPPVGGSSTVSR